MEHCEMVHGSPRACDVGSKRNAKGHAAFWIGHKLQRVAGDGGIPVRCILASASVLDCQAAIPLPTMRSARACSQYHRMDSARGTQENRAHGLSLGRVPTIDTNPRRSAQCKPEKIREAKARRAVGYTFPETRRYAERATAELVNGRRKDEFGGRNLRVRGHAKALCH